MKYSEIDCTLLSIDITLICFSMYYTFNLYNKKIVTVLRDVTYSFLWITKSQFKCIARL